MREHLYLVESSSVSDPPPERSLLPILFPDKPLIDTTERKVRTTPGHRLVARRLEYGPRVYMRSELGLEPFNITLDINPCKPVLSVLLEDERRFRTSLWFRNILKNSLLFIHLNVEKMRRPTSPSAPINFQPDGSNLPIAPLNLKGNYPQRFLWYVSHVSATLKDVEDIEIHRRPEDNFLYIVLRYRYGLKAPSWVLSDGTLRFLALSAIPFLPPQKRIFLIEEPENRIHPRAVSSLLEVLKSTSDNQIFIATHSLLLLRQMQPGDILVFRKTKEGATDIVRGTEHPALRKWRKKIPLDKLMVSGIL
ncbi:MAG: ATP-binding protein [Thermotogae bacterium]|nr:ATP-binding protein [Thermotogota bacterium]